MLFYERIRSIIRALGREHFAGWSYRLSRRVSPAPVLTEMGMKFVDGEIRRERFNIYCAIYVIHEWPVISRII